MRPREVLPGPSCSAASQGLALPSRPRSEKQRTVSSCRGGGDVALLFPAPTLKCSEEMGRDILWADTSPTKTRTSTMLCKDV